MGAWNTWPLLSSRTPPTSLHLDAPVACLHRQATMEGQRDMFVYLGINSDSPTSPPSSVLPSFLHSFVEWTFTELTWNITERLSK
jgi:hypothetical protein